MKKFLVSLSFTLIICATLVGCGSSKKTDSLLNYINVDLANVSSYENNIVESYNSITGSNYTDDFTFYYELQNNIIPLSNELIYKVESIKCDFDELRTTHELYLSAINKRHNALTLMLAAIEAQDYEKLTKCNELLSEASRGQRDYLYSLEKLCKDNNVTFNLTN